MDGSRAGQNKLQLILFFKKTSFSDMKATAKTECKAMVKEHIGRNVVTFGSIPNVACDTFWCRMGHLDIPTYFLSNSLIFKRLTV